MMSNLKSKKRIIIFGLAILTIFIAILFLRDLYYPRPISYNKLTGTFLVEPSDAKNYKLIEDRKGIDRSALQFNGIDDFILVDSSFIEFKNDFSFSFWINPQKNSSFQTLFQKGENCPDGNPNFKGSSYSMVIGEDNFLRLRLYSGNGNHGDEYLDMFTDTALDSGKWQAITVMFGSKKNEFSYYLNGIQRTVRTVGRSDPSAFKSIFQSASKLKIGAEENYCNYIHSYATHFKGALDDIYVYDRQLEMNEIKLLADIRSLSNLTWYCIFLYFIILLLTVYYSSKSFFNRLVLKIQSDDKLHESQVNGAKKISIPGVLAISTLITISYFQIFLHQADFSDTAFFGGDTWEYQSMAVNFAKGHGVQKFGGLESFTDYKFDREDPTISESFFKNKGVFNSYRTPLYSIFLGSIYKVFGISPRVAKKIQLVLLILISVSLPWIGFYYWNKSGLISGYIAGILHLIANHDLAQQILAESLFAFLICLSIIAFIFYQKFKNRLSAAFLGIFVALALLTKGNLLFVPLFLVSYFVIAFYRTRQKRLLVDGSVYLLALVIVLGSWSAFASMKTKSFVFLSTQTEAVLLDCNNEFCLDGGWHPEWRGAKSETSFYANDQMEGSSSALRVINFYLNHSEIIPTIFYNKIVRGFNGFTFLLLAMISVILLAMDKRFFFLGRRPTLRFFFVAPIFILTCCFLLISHFGLFKIPFLIPGYITLGTVILFLYVHLQRKFKTDSPFIFVIVLLNFLIMTLISFGEPRYIRVIDFLFILWGVQGITTVFTRLVEPYSGRDTIKSFTTESLHQLKSS
jgi:4-amino-4-deoxy-L-arabinose transferase-like glycosyltransferase